MISVGIIEDDAEVRVAISNYLDTQKEMFCGVSVESMEAFREIVNTNNTPDVVLCDIGLPGMSGIEGIRFMKKHFPETEIIMFTVHDDPDKIFQSLCTGASGYLLKNTPFRQIKEGILMLRSGGAPMSPEIASRVISFFHGNRPKPVSISVLTEKEREVVVGLVDGLSYKMIADRMNIAMQTVQVHIKNIYRKLHVHCKAEVITKSLRGEI
ncbi:MAG: response regulator transcription factor [Ignavibacteriae bacterium]|nr:response regulator transcription factor [Ignavibacteriota bacterium]